jgi:hypothetical protein
VLIAMHGGVKVYRGAAAAARQYVEADRGRADDYYLAEGGGIAERYTASPDGAVTREAPLTGDTYEAWVAGSHDPGDRIDNFVEPARARNRDSIRERRGVGQDVVASHLVPDRENDVRLTAVLPSDQAVKLPLRPLLAEEVRAQHDQPEARLAETPIDRPSQAVADVQAELVVPDLKMLGA